MNVPGQIGYTDTIASGTNVLCLWGTGVPLPGEAALMAAVEPYGEPFVLTYMPSTVQHVGVRVAQDTAAVELALALVNTAGTPPLLAAAPSSADGVVDIEIDGEEMKRAFIAARAAVVDATKGTAAALGTGAKVIANLPLIIGLALGGVVLLAAGAFYLSHKKG